ncbi:MAG: DNA polymerase III subunit gamma/tau [Proteobacteria bacterium]|nr:DNA polymerase III subunit gamma/tau [Pseudomonadota bacterium]
MQSGLFDMDEGSQGADANVAQDERTAQLDFGDIAEPAAKLSVSVQPATLNTPPPQHYKVLARKYRPQTFEDMIGQDVLVTTMSNALESGRVAHAFLLTGIRGVGKTTSARILARAFNCLGADGALTQPTIHPCGVCSNCTSIASDRHPDVIEMDAASHTGVNDIREIIENAKYSPISARYKVYIIDEVHMLSNNAFNALLKILEEPPAHTKFILATTEIRKVPVTILSRCQRFDLKRVSIEELTARYQAILDKEGYSAEPEAIRLVASAAGGSVRDGLSLLDQALASCGGERLSGEAVRQLLGLVDYHRVYELFASVSTGDIAQSIKMLAELYDDGADPVLLAEDLLEVTHRLTRIKTSGSNAVPQSTEREMSLAKPLAESLPMSYLARSWQLLLKGFEEVRAATKPLAALEMVLIRLAYYSSMPSLESLLAGQASDTSSPQNPPTASNLKPAANEVIDSTANAQATFNLSNEVAKPAQLPQSIQDVADLCLYNNEMTLYHHIVSEIRPISIDGTNISIALEASAPKDLAVRLRETLNRLTGTHWQIEVSPQGAKIGQDTLQVQRQTIQKQEAQNIQSNPIVKAMQEGIAGLEIAEIINA